MTTIPNLSEYLNSDFQREGYAQYLDINQFSYRCIKYLMDKNEIVWKLLKYDTPDAWKDSVPNLTQEEKGTLIYKGEEDSSLFRVFMDVGQPDVVTQEQTIIRISPYSIFPENRGVGTLSMYFEVYAHYKVNHLSNYTTRIDTIVGELLKTFNGTVIGGIGRLSFDRMGNYSARLENGSQLPFRGKWMILGNKMG